MSTKITMLHRLAKQGFTGNWLSGAHAIDRRRTAAGLFDDVQVKCQSQNPVIFRGKLDSLAEIGIRPTPHSPKYRGSKHSGAGPTAALKGVFVALQGGWQAN
jgi:hypothetical protein